MDTRTTLLALAVLAAGLVTTLVVVPRSSSTAAPDGGSVDLSGQLGALTRTQERTVQALERLETLLAERLDAPVLQAAPRRPVDDGSGTSVESLDELVEALNALRLSLETESRRTQELLRDAPALGGESLLAVRERRIAPDWVALEDLEKTWRQDEDLADRSQYFQTARDLLETYGPPTAIYRPKGGGLLFHYRNIPLDTPGTSWYFRLQDGFVVEFWIEEEGGTD